MTSAHTIAPAARPVPAAGDRAWRKLAGCLTIAATLPYLTLKLIWIAGGTVGITDEKFAHDGGLLALNVLTLGLDATAVLVALALTYGWGRRRPAWLVLFPAWIGAGLLGPIAITMPVAAAGSLFATTFDDGGPLRPWVFAMVYTGFTVQGAGLTAAFAGYARERWAGVLSSRTADGVPGATRSVQAFGAALAAAVLAVVAGVRLFWAVGGTAGLTHEEVAHRAYTTYVVSGVYGLLAVAAAVGLLLMVHRRGRTPLWIPLTATWLGAGAMFAWGGWGMLNVLLGTVLAGGDTGLTPAVDFLQVIGGMLAAMTGVVRLVDVR